LTLLNNDDVFESLNNTVGDPCSLRKKFVEGVQNAYKEKHLSCQQPRDRVQVYEVQVNGLAHQKVAISGATGTKSTFFCFTICSEPILRRHLSHQLQNLILTLACNRLLGFKPKAMLRLYEVALQKKLEGTELRLGVGSDEGTVWALQAWNGAIVNEVGWGIIEDGEI
jgi:hypothetical protein